MKDKCLADIEKQIFFPEKMDNCFTWTFFV